MPISILRHDGVTYYSDDYMKLLTRELREDNDEFIQHNSDLRILIDKLHSYVQHKSPCRKSNWDFFDPCECGLDAVLARMEEIMPHN
jgi:hypothetical protein